MSLSFFCIFLFAQNSLAEIIWQENYDGITSNTHPQSGVGGLFGPPTPTNGAQIDWFNWAGDAGTDSVNGVSHYEGEITDRGRNGGKALTQWRRSTQQGLRIHYKGAQPSAQMEYTGYATFFLKLYAPSGNLVYSIDCSKYSSLGDLADYINSLPDWEAIIGPNVTRSSDAVGSLAWIPSPVDAKTSGYWIPWSWINGNGGYLGGFYPASIFNLQLKAQYQRHPSCGADGSGSKLNQA